MDVNQGNLITGTINLELERLGLFVCKAWPRAFHDDHLSLFCSLTKTCLLQFLNLLFWLWLILAALEMIYEVVDKLLNVSSHPLL